MKIDHAKAHMRTAYNYADLSHCEKKKVGCIVVSADGERIISVGLNGTPPGEDNFCELPCGKTKPSVRHAEKNAIGKLAGSHESARDGYVFITLSPCLECATLIDVAKVKSVYYDEEYRTREGIEFLQRRGIEVTQLSPN